MSQYYCPFCSSRYQFHKTSSNGVLICGLCGDPLIKKTSLNSRRIIGVVAALAFLAPLLTMIIFIIADFTKEKRPKNSESLVLLTTYKTWKI
ncbi:hypothetical protein [Prochlorococcus sp. MIT 0916]|uniref:hypothetical protein n=1 Tax=Prochlorococcus sp. MIT 0916 TaxID=3082521 RepID=UPI0039B58D42